MSFTGEGGKKRIFMEVSSAVKENFQIPGVSQELQK